MKTLTYPLGIAIIIACLGCGDDEETKEIPVPLAGTYSGTAMVVSDTGEVSSNITVTLTVGDWTESDYEPLGMGVDVWDLTGSVSVFQLDNIDVEGSFTDFGNYDSMSVYLESTEFPINEDVQTIRLEGEYSGGTISGEATRIVPAPPPENFTVEPGTFSVTKQ